MRSDLLRILTFEGAKHVRPTRTKRVLAINCAPSGAVAVLAVTGTGPALLHKALAQHAHPERIHSLRMHCSAPRALRLENARLRSTKLEVAVGQQTTSNAYLGLVATLDPTGKGPSFCGKEFAQHAHPANIPPQAMHCSAPRAQQWRATRRSTKLAVAVGQQATNNA